MTEITKLAMEQIAQEIESTYPAVTVHRPPQMGSISIVIVPFKSSITLRNDGQIQINRIMATDYGLLRYIPDLAEGALQLSVANS